MYNNPINSTDPTGLGCGITSPGDCIDAVVEAADDAGEFVVRNRHTIIDVGTTIGGATVAAGCGITIACGLAVGGVALVGTAAHIGSDALSNDEYNISGWDAAGRGFINSYAGAACGWTFGQGCGPATLGRTTAGRAALPWTTRWMFRTEASVASGRLAAGAYWGFTGFLERMWRFGTDC